MLHGAVMQDLGIFLPGEYRQRIFTAANDCHRDSGRMACARQETVGGLALSLDEEERGQPAGISERDYGVLLRALQFYADRQHLTVGEFGIAVEDGKRARLALAAIAGRDFI